MTLRAGRVLKADALTGAKRVALELEEKTLPRGQVVPKAELEAIRAEFENHLDAGTCLNKISKDSARKPGDFTGAEVFLGPDEVRLGQAHYRKHANYVSLNEPLINSRSVVPIAFRESLTGIAAEYFGCAPAIGSLNLRKSFANGIPEFDTLYFHCDENCPDFLKFFFYLNDVDLEGGPFCYVRGSHRNRFPGWRSKYRWTHEEIATKYPEQDILFNTAQAGDLIIANTTGFHRGTKVLARDRSMLTLDYVVHEEYWGKTPKFKIRRSDLARFTPEQKILADYLTPTD